MELLVAAFIGTFLLLILFSVFLTNKQIYQLHEALTGIQERGRLAHHLLTTHLHIAGYIGCANINDMMIHDHVHTHSLLPIMGYHIDNNRYILPSEIRDKVRANTDVLILQMAETDHGDLLNMTPNTLAVTAAPSFNNDTVLLISDCEHGDIVQLTNVNYDTKIKLQFLSSKQKITYHYQAHAAVSKYLFLIFYIADTGRKNATGNPIYALYCRNLHDNKHIQTEMVEGIENMAFEYGIMDKKKQRIKYYKAAAIADWSQIISVKFALLLSSIEPTLITPAVYQFAGKHYHAKDLRLYRSWQRAVTLRQRSLF